MSRKRPTLPRHKFPVVGDPMPRPKPPTPVRVARMAPELAELRRKTVWSRGPEILQLAHEAAHLDAPGDPPAGFVTATTSKEEWAVWFWLFEIMGMYGDVRRLPDYNFPPPGANGQFFYQVNFFGGRHGAGGAVVDFIVPRSPYGQRALILRLQSEHYHVFTQQTNIDHDLFQKLRLFGDGLTVIDIYSQHLGIDPLRRRGSIPAVLIDALQGISWVGPLDGGNPMRTHSPI